MKALIQRVTRALVTVEQQIVGEIDSGLLVLLGIDAGDTESVADRLARGGELVLVEFHHEVSNGLWQFTESVNLPGRHGRRIVSKFAIMVIPKR